MNPSTQRSITFRARRAEERERMREALVMAESALDKCRAIIKFHTKPDKCCAFSSEAEPFSALDAFRESVGALATVRQALSPQGKKGSDA